MSQLLGNALLSGSGLTEGQCLPCPGVSGRAVALNPCCSRFHYRFNSPVAVKPLRYASVCKALSNNGGYNRRNPDFSRQNRHGFSRSRNRQQNDERDKDRDRDRDRDNDGFENMEEPDILSSKNGPYLSLSSSPKFQATAVPGPREKEIVELFRKVQAQLRERAASKDAKRAESAQGQDRENETVDSLLKLLRKHSTEQSKRNSSYDQQGQNSQYIRGKTPSSFASNNGVRDHARDSFSSSSRPLSNFQRKSPIPRLKSEPAYSDNDDDEDDDTVDSAPIVNSSVKGRKSHELDLQFEPEIVNPRDEPEPESALEAEPVLAQLLEDDLLNNSEEAQTGEESEAENEDLNGWKLTELRALAKSRGLKGYSKMKKAELVDLLGSASA